MGAEVEATGVAVNFNLSFTVWDVCTMLDSGSAKEQWMSKR